MREEKEKKKKKKRIPSRWVLVLFFRTVRPPPFARASHPSSPVTWYCHISITLYTSTNRDSVSFFFFLFLSRSFHVHGLQSNLVHISLSSFYFFFLPAIHFFFILPIYPPIFLFHLFIIRHIYTVYAFYLPSISAHYEREGGRDKCWNTTP